VAAATAAADSSSLPLLSRTELLSAICDVEAKKGDGDNGDLFLFRFPVLFFRIARVFDKAA